MKTKIEKKTLSKQKILEKNQTLQKERTDQKKKLQEQEEKNKESITPKKRGRPPKIVVVVDSQESSAVKEKKVKRSTKVSKPAEEKNKLKNPIKTTRTNRKQALEKKPKQEESEEKQQVIKTLDGHYQTPVLPVKYSSVKKPYKFANNDIPRYSITLILDEKKNKHFISQLEQLRAQQQAENFRNEMSYINDRGFKISTGKSLIKFQRKEKIPIYNKEGEELELTDEIPEQTMVSVVFEVRCYLNKRTNQNAFNLSPHQIFIHEVPSDKK